MAREQFSRKRSLLFAAPFAPVRPGWQPKAPLSNSAPRPRPPEFTRFTQCRLALGPRRALAQVLLRSFRPVFSDAPADSGPEVLPVTPGVDSSLTLPEHGPCLVGGTITLDDASFTTKIAVHSEASALAPYGCVDATYWIASPWWGRHPSRASGTALLVSGVVIANLPLCKRRRASAWASIFFKLMSPRAPFQYGLPWYPPR